MSDGRPAPLTYRYTFAFDDGTQRVFTMALDRDTLEMLAPQRSSWPEWTALGYRQCANCPLKPEQSPRCPIAANLVEVVAFLHDRLSYEEVEVTVEGHGRKYVKRTALQHAAASLIGIFTVSSGCPILSRLRPMVATHLPFMTPEESTYRLISMYLMAQFFRHRHGRSADWELQDLVAFLHVAHETNSAFCRRLAAIGVKDASLNALAGLNAMGEMTSLSIESRDEDLRRLERFFALQYEPE
jgi:hypothetical protein